MLEHAKGAKGWLNASQLEHPLGHVLSQGGTLHGRKQNRFAEKISVRHNCPSASLQPLIPSKEGCRAWLCQPCASIVSLVPAMSSV